MYDIEFLLRDNPEFFIEENDAKKHWQAVHEQAIRHTRLMIEGDDNPLISRLRPTETEKLRKYRNDNFRQYTLSGVHMYRAKCYTVIKDCVPEYDTISSVLSEWLDTKPLQHFSETKSLKQFAADVLLTQSLENPNYIPVALPYVEGDPSMIPNETDGLARMGIKIKMIS